MLCCADLAPLYQQLCEDLGWSQDAGRLTKMQQANEAKCTELEEKIKDADENLGDIEVRDACQAKADYLCKLGESKHACICVELCIIRCCTCVGVKLGWG